MDTLIIKECFERLDKSGANAANYVNKAEKSVPDYAVCRANGTEDRGDAGRLKTESNIENLVSITIIATDFHH